MMVRRIKIVVVTPLILSPQGNGEEGDSKSKSKLKYVAVEFD